MFTTGIMQLIKLMVKLNANNEQLLEIFGLFEIENIAKHVCAVSDVKT